MPMPTRHRMAKPRKRQPYVVQRASWRIKSKRYDPNVNGAQEIERRRRQIMAGQLQYWRPNAPAGVKDTGLWKYVSERDYKGNTRYTK